MKLPKGATLDLSLKENGSMGMKGQFEIETRTDARLLAAAIRVMGRSLPDTTPRGSRAKAVASRLLKRRSRKGSAVNAAPAVASAT